MAVLEFKFETFQSYYNQGIEAYNLGDHINAKRLLLKAADEARELSLRYPSADMRKEFADKANDIVGFVQSNINKQSVRATNPVGREQGRAGTSKGYTGRNHEDDDSFEQDFAPIAVDDITTTFDDIAGLDDVKTKIIQNIILPLKHPETYKKYGLKAGGTVLMYGPPGTGKTMIARATAKESGASFFEINPHNIKSKWQGDTEKRIASLFEVVRKNLPAVVFLDEFDALARSRNEGDNSATTIVPALIKEIDGFRSSTDGILILCATNVPWSIDQAIISRSSNLYLPFPDIEARAKIFFINLKNIPKQEIDYVLLADATDGMSGRDIGRICTDVKQKLASFEIANKQSRPLTLEDIQAQIDILKKQPRASAKLFEAYNERNSDSLL